ncbi:MAG: diguanylate cyclase [Myxococcaceae bacterium]|nr:diguanylate cyclase [Myxococcaceae bacterium]
MAQVLLVDDEKVARALYGDFLTGAGHQVTAVATSAAALVELEKQPFDVLVADLILPESDGMVLLQRTKAQWPETEVVIITALDQVEAAVRAIKNGAADYLVKPVNPEVLASAVARAIATRSVLRENEALRRHVSLLETGQRLATTLDRARLAELAPAAFESACHAAAALFALPGEKGWEILGQHGLAEDQAEALSEQVEAALRHGVDPKGQELALTLPKGLETAYLMPAHDGDVVRGAVALFYSAEISDQGLEAAAFLARHLGLALRTLGKFAEVEDLAYLDDLTHLFNSRYLQLLLDKELRAQPAGSQPGKPFSLLFLDLDYFKSVNDTHGHVVGSKLLVEVARVLKGCVRDGDVVTRYGGDEYVIYLRGTDSGGALKVGERIRRSIETHKFLAREGYSLQITTSIGVASYPEHAQDKATLLDNADRAMYRGKKGSRNIIYVAAKGLEATPQSRHLTPAQPGKPDDTVT